MGQKVLIVGAKGMLGQAWAKVFFDQKSILWDMEELDITNKKEVEDKLEELKPTLIINAAAYTDVDGAQTNKDLALAVNGEAVGHLAQVASKLSAVIVHYSTDYVFEGEKTQGYQEDEQPNPLGIYGQSKLLGEKLLRQKAKKYYLIRSSWLFGKNGEKNFVRKILTKAVQESRLKVVNDHFGKPTYAKDLAQKTREIIESQKPYGIYHVTNETPEGGITWYDLAKKAIEQVGLSHRINHLTSQLSGGEKQRVAIARALINEPKLYSLMSQPAT